MSMLRMPVTSMWVLLTVAMGAVSGLPPVSAAERHEGEPVLLFRPARDVLWDAALLALRERGLTVDVMALDEGQITSVFVPLEVDTLGRFTESSVEASSLSGAEYRYVLNLGDLPDRARIAVRAEIRGRVRTNGTSEPEPQRTLRSNHVLEKDFMREFSSALGRLGGD